MQTNQRKQKKMKRIPKVTEVRIEGLIKSIARRADVRVSRGTDDKNRRCIQLNKTPVCGYLRSREFSCVLEGVLAGLNAGSNEIESGAAPAISGNLVKEVMGLVNACQATGPAIPEHARQRLMAKAGAGAARAGSGHTPGPWSVTHQTATDNSWDVVSQTGQCVATCGCSIDEHSHVAANARLIACAPALLAALKRVVGGDMSNAALEQANAAIAAAERGTV